MKLDTKKFCKTFATKAHKLSPLFERKNMGEKEVGELFHFIHELNGVALSYGYEHIGFVTASAHETIHHYYAGKKALHKEIAELFKAYIEMITIILEEGSENHLNTKEAMHMLDDFKFHLASLEEDKAA